jgi:hypothetical protein
MSSLMQAAVDGDLPRVQMLAESGESLGAAMLCATSYGKLPVVTWILEHGGGDIAEANARGDTIWHLLKNDPRIRPQITKDHDTAELSALLRVMVLRGVPPAGHVARLRIEHTRILEDGMKLRARLPKYLKRRRALIDQSCPLIADLQAIVSSYEEPTTTEELWATAKHRRDDEGQTRLCIVQ